MAHRNVGWMIWLAILPIALGSCAASLDNESGDAGQTTEVQVDPQSTTLYVGQSRGFEAKVTGAASAEVDWAVGEGAIGGTVSSDGFYTAPSGVGTFHVVATSRADPTKKGAATVSVTKPTPVDGAPMTTANRTGGVAPLLVFFDAIDTTPSGTASPFSWTSGVVQPADPEGSQYSWGFGDPGSGTWSTTGKSRNQATGYTAAHVFEAPGTYTVSLSVTDTSGITSTYVQTVTVTAFSGTTYYAAASGSDSNDGLSESTPFKTFAHGASVVSGASNRRLLLRRGDRFTSSGQVLSVAGPGIIGAYGTGVRPVVNFDAGGITIRGQDWRVMDVDFYCSSATDTSPSSIGYDVEVQTRNALVLRSRSTNGRVGMGNGIASKIYANPHDGNGWVECEVATPYVNGMYIGGRRLAVMGCDIHDAVTSHLLRVWEAHKGVISNNRLWNPGPTRHALKLCSPGYTKGQPETRWVSVTDNVTRGKTWSWTLGPQDSGADERVSHVVAERNRFFGESSIQIDIRVSSRYTLIRNNLFDGTGSASYRSIYVGPRGIEPVPDHVRILNNTMARTDGQELTGVEMDSASTNVTVRNNLASAGSATTTMISGSGGSGWVADHNLATATPGFRSPSTGDFGLASTSIAIGGGLLTGEVREDFARAPRPTTAPSRGAYEPH